MRAKSFDNTDIERVEFVATRSNVENSMNREHTKLGRLVVGNGAVEASPSYGEPSPMNQTTHSENPEESISVSMIKREGFLFQIDEALSSRNSSRGEERSLENRQALERADSLTKKEHRDDSILTIAISDLTTFVQEEHDLPSDCGDQFDAGVNNSEDSKAAEIVSVLRSVRKLVAKDSEISSILNTDEIPRIGEADEIMDQSKCKIILVDNSNKIAKSYSCSDIEYFVVLESFDDKERTDPTKADQQTSGETTRSDMDSCRISPDATSKAAVVSTTSSGCGSRPRHRGGCSKARCRKTTFKNSYDSDETLGGETLSGAERLVYTIAEMTVATLDPCVDCFLCGTLCSKSQLES